MKITSTDISRQSVSSKWIDFVFLRAHKKAGEQVKETRAHGHNQFSAWPEQPDRRLNLLAFGVKEPKVNIRALEQFLKRTSPEDISYRGLLSSHLLHGSLDAQSAAEMQKTIALQKMVALVNATIADMKMIELNHLARNKG